MSHDRAFLTLVLLLMLHCRHVSMGVGQGPIAENYIESARKVRAVSA